MTPSMTSQAAATPFSARITAAVPRRAGAPMHLRASAGGLPLPYQRYSVPGQDVGRRA